LRAFEELRAPIERIEVKAKETLDVLAGSIFRSPARKSRAHSRDDVFSLFYSEWIASILGIPLLTYSLSPTLYLH